MPGELKIGGKANSKAVGQLRKSRNLEILVRYIDCELAQLDRAVGKG